jgi:hypothetical protein
MWSNDHAPPHVHVFSGDAEARIELGRHGSRPRVAVNCGMKRSDRADALRAVSQNQAALLERWSEIHG